MLAVLRQKTNRIIDANAERDRDDENGGSVQRDPQQAHDSGHPIMPDRIVVLDLANLSKHCEGAAEIGQGSQWGVCLTCLLFGAALKGIDLGHKAFRSRDPLRPTAEL